MEAPPGARRPQTGSRPQAPDQGAARRPQTESRGAHLSCPGSLDGQSLGDTETAQHCVSGWTRAPRGTCRMMTGQKPSTCHRVAGVAAPTRTPSPERPHRGQRPPQEHSPPPPPCPRDRGSVKQGHSCSGPSFSLVVLLPSSPRPKLPAQLPAQWWTSPPPGKPRGP